MKSQLNKVILGLMTVTSLSSCAKIFGDLQPTSTKLNDDTVQTQQFLSDYSGRFIEPDFKETFVISPDATISRIEIRQVGSQDSKTVPYPTVCSYIKTGKLLSVSKRSEDSRKKYMDFATHVLEVQYTNITLTNDLEEKTTANPNCHNFASERKALIAAQGAIQHSYHAELLNENSIRVHTSGGGDYVPGSARTESTLDETHVRSQAN